MEKELDIQLFAEETASEETAKPEEPTEAAEKDSAPEAEQPPEVIPSELDGLPEEIAREAMKEAGKNEAPPAPAESENSDNKPSDSGRNTSIPYPRFKEQVDKSNALEEQLAAYRERYGDLSAPKPQPQPQQPTPAPAAPPPPSQPMQFTPEISQRIEEVVRQRALSMTGLSAEDLQSLQEYGDADNAKLTTYENARAMARTQVMSEINEAVRARQAQARAFLEAHQRMVDDFNGFYQHEAGEPDFKEVQGHATGVYFEQLPPVEQSVIRDAYARVERQTASPQDILLIKRYFAEAKADYRAKAAVRTAAPAPKDKPKLPRAGEVDGSAAAPGEGVTAESLARMLDENKFSDIPPQYQKLLLDL